MGECGVHSASVANQRLPGLGAHDTVRFEASCVLKTGDRDAGVRPVIAVDRNAVTGAAQRMLEASNVISYHGRALDLEWSNETDARLCSTERRIGCGTGNPVRRQSMGPLKSPDCSRGCGSIETIDGNREFMPPQEALELDDARPLRDRLL